WRGQVEKPIVFQDAVNLADEVIDVDQMLDRGQGDGSVERAVGEWESFFSIIEIERHSGKPSVAQSLQACWADVVADQLRGIVIPDVLRGIAYPCRRIDDPLVLAVFEDSGKDPMPFVEAREIIASFKAVQPFFFEIDSVLVHPVFPPRFARFRTLLTNGLGSFRSNTAKT